MNSARPTVDSVTAVIVTRGDIDLAPCIDALPYKKLIVWNNSLRPDTKIYGRYLAIKEVTTPFVYFQDDDVIFRRHDELMAAWEPGLMVVNMDEPWVQAAGYERQAMVGAGSIMAADFPRPYLARYLEQWPLDEDFLLDCDFVLGALAPFKRVDLGYEARPEADDPARLFYQPGQQARKWKLVRRARRLRDDYDPSSGDAPHIRLTMIVRDEHDYIEETLAAARHVCDSWCIVDTGSTDDTPELVTRLLADLPGELHRREWEGHAVCRTEALRLGREGCDYQLMLDADLTVEQIGPLGSLTAGAYNIPIHDRALVYPLPLLTSTRHDWSYQGPAHSYLWREGEDEDRPTLPALRLIDRGGGPRRPGKLEDDLARLQRAIAENTLDARSWFYLAQTYRDLGKIDEAIVAYTTRTNLNGWDEERFMAMYQGGVALCAKTVMEGIPMLFRAWQMRPHRAEPLRAIAAACNGIADQLPLPDDILFVEPGAYTRSGE